MVVVIRVRFEDYLANAYWYHGNSNDPFSKIDSVERQTTQINGKKIYHAIRYNDTLYKDLAAVLKKNNLGLSSSEAMLDKTWGYVTNDQKSTIRIMYVSAVACSGVRSKAVVSDEGRNCLENFKGSINAALEIE